MDFSFSERATQVRARLLDFMAECVYPSEAVYAAQMAEAGDPHAVAPVLEELKVEARSRGLWNLFLPDAELGAGLTVGEYAPLAEIMGRSVLASEACNCSPPDSGNMELLAMYGSAEQKSQWLAPLLDGTIRSAFAMTEPDRASSDATNIAMRFVRDGDDYVLNGRKWWTSGALDPRCAFLIVMGRTSDDGPRHRQQSQIIVPMDAEGLTVLRNLPVFGYRHREGHGEIEFDNVRVPASNLIGKEGDGFAIAQGRLGPGRIHHCMRTVGAAERALEMMIDRSVSRSTFGERIAERANVRDWIAQARIDIDMVRLLTLEAAWLMDTVGYKQAASKISAIKIAAPEVGLRVVDQAIQIHGGAGVSDDTILAELWAHLRTMRIVDGPDEVHRMAIARHEIRSRAGQGA
ncbi:acyl-CoA dehydrogenase family protein [Streptomyces malaysiensis]|uniref:Acyl-CoA dehydrogenase family protein n=1 Tax=Streptomyces malaysiensis subsp. samsunensis TaxID=459658 RepID=A0A9X2S0J6_STRMQ|nr:acyl-CoA dehydrogenase family protein [Streptomyces samsunensis]MCQ8835485.1 acyl-CoA dehydrogenase family protein [Streptomyces samsunensis]WPB89889.1 acyl-CoA dehydrogenase family protein [Streptomyces malaysiensis]